MDQPNPRARSGVQPIDWTAALAEHDRWLRTLVLARVRERPAIDEVMQEVAAAAIAQKAPITDGSKVAPWLYRIAVRQSLLYRRRRGRQRKFAEHYARLNRRPPAGTPCGDPLDWLLADERRRLVRVALDRLPRRDAEILLLKYTEDWSYRELAARLGVTESAIEARLHRARGRLRSELATLHVVEVSP